MNVLAEALKVLAAEKAAFESDRLRYAAPLRAFVEEHGLDPVVAKGWELMKDKGEREFGRARGFPFFHGLRVARHALWLAEQPELQDADIDQPALFVAALFHDACHVSRDDDHPAEGAELMRRELAGLLDAPRLERAAELVRRSDDADAARDCVEAQVLYDANTLDLHGAAYIWRAIAFAGAAGLPAAQALIALRETLETHRAWIEKTHFEAARAALAEKSREEDRILAALEREIGLR